MDRVLPAGLRRAHRAAAPSRRPPGGEPVVGRAGRRPGRQRGHRCGGHRPHPADHVRQLGGHRHDHRVPAAGPAADPGRGRDAVPVPLAAAGRAVAAHCGPRPVRRRRRGVPVRGGAGDVRLGRDHRRRVGAGRRPHRPDARLADQADRAAPAHVGAARHPPDVDGGRSRAVRRRPPAADAPGGGRPGDRDRGGRDAPTRRDVPGADGARGQPPAGPHRRADRARQPTSPVRGRPAAHRGPGRHAGGGAAAARPRPVQGGQRHAGAPGRRRHAARRRTTAQGVRPAASGPRGAVGRRRVRLPRDRGRRRRRSAAGRGRARGARSAPHRGRGAGAGRGQHRDRRAAGRRRRPPDAAAVRGRGDVLRQVPAARRLLLPARAGRVHGGGPPGDDRRAPRGGDLATHDAALPAEDRRSHAGRSAASRRSSAGSTRRAACCHRAPSSPWSTTPTS